MPAGDPAGYLPSVIKKRLKSKGARPYRGRGSGVVPKAKPSVDPETGGVQGPAPMPARPAKRKRPGNVPKPGAGKGARYYFGRSK